MFEEYLQIIQYWTTVDQKSLMFFTVQVRKQISKLTSALQDLNMGYLVKPGMTTTPENSNYPNFNSQR